MNQLKDGYITLCEKCYVILGTCKCPAGTHKPMLCEKCKLLEIEDDREIQGSSKDI